MLKIAKIQDVPVETIACVLNGVMGSPSFIVTVKEQHYTSHKSLGTKVSYHGRWANEDDIMLSPATLVVYEETENKNQTSKGEYTMEVTNEPTPRVEIVLTNDEEIVALKDILQTFNQQNTCLGQARFAKELFDNISRVYPH